MQYIRRRIQRVSGVTIRDERVESRDFSVPSWRQDWDELSADRRQRSRAQRDARSLEKQGINFRERN
jgi:hypothetical protein